MSIMHSRLSRLYFSLHYLSQNLSGANMRSIIKAVRATPLGSDKSSLQLSRVIGTVDIDGNGTKHEVEHVDPFLFLDDAHIQGVLPTSFNKHPHTGLMAVTYLLEGTAHAWDNINGATSDLNRAGGVYCVNSGRGIVHGEAAIEGVRELRLLQLWFNPDIYQFPLPKAEYQLFQPDELPVYHDDEIWAKIIIGEGFNLTSPVTSPWPISYMHIKLAPKVFANIQIPEPDWNGFIYVINGSGTFGINHVPGAPQQCLLLGQEHSSAIPVQNEEHATLEFILATGQAHHKSFVKLLGHGGAIIADTEKNARDFMKHYESDPEHFGAAD